MGMTPLPEGGMKSMADLRTPEKFEASSVPSGVDPKHHAVLVQHGFSYVTNRGGLQEYKHSLHGTIVRHSPQNGLSYVQDGGSDGGVIRGTPHETANDLHVALSKKYGEPK